MFAPEGQVIVAIAIERASLIDHRTARFQMVLQQVEDAVVGFVACTTNDVAFL